jgi:hypothetical protein
MNEHIISKALEIWSLQSLLDIAIILGILSMGLAIVLKYYSSLEKFLTLRVSIEIWQLLTILFTDIFLVIVVIVGFLVLNPDIMADIKVAVPFTPLATVLFAIALIIRLFYDGHKPESKNYNIAIWLIFIANLLNIIGFSLVMEAPGEEYLSIYPSTFWSYLKTHFRSNAIPHGIELAQVTFYVCFPLLIAVFVWGFVSFLNYSKKKNG